jgi:hypothetical protein
MRRLMNRRSSGAETFLPLFVFFPLCSRDAAEAKYYTVACYLVDLDEFEKLEKEREE